MHAAVEIESRVIAGAAGGPRPLVVAGVHGDEYEPMEAARRLAAAIAARPFRGSLTVVPVANPTAFAAGSRTGADGLDMARSFPGNASGSPTERAAHAVTALIRQADALIDLHTGGRALRVLPMTGYTLHPRADILDAQRRMALAFGLPVVWGTSPALEGRSLSAARDLGVPAIYVEHGGGGGCDETGVTTLVEGCLAVMRHLGMLADAPAATAAPRPLVVEDARPGSGHMQAGHPAAVAGFFRAAVGLGARVRTGDLLGTITDPLGGSSHEVRACAAGLVLVLRVEPSVRPGDPLAVVLEAAAGDEPA